MGEEWIFVGVYGRRDVIGGRRGRMKYIVARVERYLERKGLVLNIGKSKIIRFREGEVGGGKSGGGREEKVWRK